MHPSVVLLLPKIVARNVDCTFSLHIPNYLGHRIFRRYGDQHVNMVRLQMPFQYLTLLLPSQLMQNLTKVLSQLAIKRFLSTLRYPHDVVLAFPPRVASTLCVVHEASFS